MTYSIGTQGRPADNPAQPLSQVISDDSVNGPGAEQQTMMLGEQFLCKGPDGQQAFYMYDAERSIPGVLRVLRKL